MRGEIEQVVQRQASVDSSRSPTGLAERLRARLDGEGIMPHLSINERIAVEKSLGSWSSQNITDASWRVEALGVILWALSSLEALPPYDTQFAPKDVLALVGFDASVRDFVKKAKLRGSKHISKARDVAELWHWRARTTQAQRKGVAPPDGWTFEKIISKAAEQAQKKDFIRPIDGDFPAFGKPYAKLSEDEYIEATSIAQERHYALNWLCGYSLDWDATPTDT